MSEEPRELTPEEKAAKRAAFDRVFAVANAERTEMISLYDIATWLLYACARSDAISSAKEMRENEDSDEDPYWDEYSIRDEIIEQMELASEDSESATAHEHDTFALGEQLDPDFEKPVIALVDWLDDVQERQRKRESADVLRHVVDNAIDSSRRPARKREK
jgi:hypothetical protein